MPKYILKRKIKSLTGKKWYYVKDMFGSVDAIQLSDGKHLMISDDIMSYGYLDGYIEQWVRLEDMGQVRVDVGYLNVIDFWGGYLMSVKI